MAVFANGVSGGAITLNRTWTEGGQGGKEMSARDFSLTTQTSPGNGSDTNSIPASAFQLTKIEEVSALLWNSTDSLAVGAVPSPDGTKLYLINLEAAVDADRGNAVDFISKAFRGVIKGQPL